MKDRCAPPKDDIELMQRAKELCGLSLNDLAKLAELPLPENLNRAKGWVGQIIEWYLGASSGNKPQPDFDHLGIELKTLPIGFNGKPLETTFVCVAPLTGIYGITWEKSHVKNKLAKVLWVPIEAERTIPLAKRRIGLPILWQPSPAEEIQLKSDWEELMSFISLGKVHEITAKHGEALQLRPKAANSQVLTQAYDKNGSPTKAQPKGFYLRTQFTTQIIENALDNLS